MENSSSERSSFRAAGHSRSSAAVVHTYAAVYDALSGVVTLVADMLDGIADPLAVVYDAIDSFSRIRCQKLRMT